MSVILFNLLLIIANIMATGILWLFMGNHHVPLVIWWLVLCSNVY